MTLVMLLGGPGPPTLDASLLLVAAVNEIFASLKNIQKSTPQKTSFFRYFLNFQVFQSRFFSIFSYSGTPLVVIFGHFSGLTFFIDFFEHFCHFFENLKK